MPFELALKTGGNCLKIITVVIIVSLTYSVTSATEYSCPDANDEVFERSCFSFHESSLVSSYADAERFCSNEGKQLAKITTQGQTYLIARSLYLRNWTHALVGLRYSTTAWHWAPSSMPILGQGCYKSPEEAVMQKLPNYSKSQIMTIDKCLQFCSLQGVLYASIHYASFCYCSHDYIWRESASNCSMACAGSNDQNCGSYINSRTFSSADGAFDNWKIGRPSVYGSCGAIKVDHVINPWVDTGCALPLPFICEFSTDLVVSAKDAGAFSCDITACYYLYGQTTLPWNQAQRFCWRKGGRLATITSNYQQSTVNKALYQWTKGKKGMMVWTGATNTHWVYPDGSDMTFDGWVVPNEPVAPITYSCSVIAVDTIGEYGLQSKRCENMTDIKNRFICSFDLATTTAAPTTTTPPTTVLPPADDGDLVVLMALNSDTFSERNNELFEYSNAVAAQRLEPTSTTTAMTTTTTTTEQPTTSTPSTTKTSAMTTTTTTTTTTKTTKKTTKSPPTTTTLKTTKKATEPTTTTTTSTTTTTPTTSTTSSTSSAPSTTTKTKKTTKTTESSAELNLEIVEGVADNIVEDAPTQSTLTSKSIDKWTLPPVVQFVQKIAKSAMRKDGTFIDDPVRVDGNTLCLAICQNVTRSYGKVSIRCVAFNESSDISVSEQFEDSLKFPPYEALVDCYLLTSTSNAPYIESAAVMAYRDTNTRHFYSNKYRTTTVAGIHKSFGGFPWYGYFLIVAILLIGGLCIGLVVVVRKRRKNKIAVETRPKIIFISYCRRKKRHKPLVEKIAKTLEFYDYEVRYDSSTFRSDISIENALSKEIERADCVLVCYNEDYNKSETCCFEAQLISSKQKPYIPVKIEAGFQPIAWLAAFLADKKAIDYVEADVDNSTKRIVLDVQGVIKHGNLVTC